MRAQKKKKEKNGEYFTAKVKNVCVLYRYDVHRWHTYIYIMCMSDVGRKHPYLNLCTFYLENNLKFAPSPARYAVKCAKISLVSFLPSFAYSV